MHPTLVAGNRAAAIGNLQTGGKLIRSPKKRLVEIWMCAQVILLVSVVDLHAAESSAAALAQAVRQLADVTCAVDELEICGPAPNPGNAGYVEYDNGIRKLTEQQQRATRTRRNQLQAGDFEGAARTVQAIRVLGLARSVLESRPGADGSWDDICAHMACISALHSYLDVLARQALSIEVLERQTPFGATVEVRGGDGETLVVVDATTFRCFPDARDGGTAEGVGTEPAEVPPTTRKPPTAP